MPSRQRSPVTCAFILLRSGSRKGQKDGLATLQKHCGAKNTTRGARETRATRRGWSGSRSAPAGKARVRSMPNRRACGRANGDRPRCRWRWRRFASSYPCRAAGTHRDVREIESHIVAPARTGIYSASPRSRELGHLAPPAMVRDASYPVFVHRPAASIRASCLRST